MRRVCYLWNETSQRVITQRCCVQIINNEYRAIFSYIKVYIMITKLEQSWNYFKTSLFSI